MSKLEVIRLRKQGKTYSEITKEVGRDIPKGTLSYWCHGLNLPLKARMRLTAAAKRSTQKARILALEANRGKREKYLKSVIDRNIHLAKVARDKDTAKLMLAMLYLGEGGKTLQRASLLFGNSNPLIIGLFLRLLRYCYLIDERKFRCTLQCRADQDIRRLERFWSNITNIPPQQFYKAQIDPRTKGKVTKNKNYKGVCRIDFFSADIFTDLIKIAELVYNEGP